MPETTVRLSFFRPSGIWVADSVVYIESAPSVKFDHGGVIATNHIVETVRRRQLDRTLTDVPDGYSAKQMFILVKLTTPYILPPIPSVEERTAHIQFALAEEPLRRGTR